MFRSLSLSIVLCALTSSTVWATRPCVAVAVPSASVQTSVSVSTLHVGSVAVVQPLAVTPLVPLCVEAVRANVAVQAQVIAVPEVVAVRSFPGCVAPVARGARSVVASREVTRAAVRSLQRFSFAPRTAARGRSVITTRAVGW